MSFHFKQKQQKNTFNRFIDEMLIQLFCAQPQHHFNLFMFVCVFFPVLQLINYAI